MGSKFKKEEENNEKKVQKHLKVVLDIIVLVAKKINITVLNLVGLRVEEKKGNVLDIEI